MSDVNVSPNKPLMAPKQVAMWLLVACLCRIFLAAIIPLGNDEAYYWDWGRDLKLSYFDHPPGVAWLSALAITLFSSLPGNLEARGMPPILHLSTSWLLFLIYVRLAGPRRTRRGDLAFFAVSQLTPAFAIGGFALLPDSGLLFFTTAGLLYIIKLRDKIRESDSFPGIKQGIFLGVIAGLAGLFKYHAAPIFGGMLLAFAATEKWRLLKQVKFWAAVIVFGLATTLPVWIWNYQNDFASLAFQAKRGAVNPQIDLPRAMRTLAGEFIYLSPGFFWLLILSLVQLWRHRRRDLDRLILWTTLPLLAIIHVTMFYKEILPHWALPAFWLLIPQAAIFAGNTWRSRKVMLNTAVSLLLTLVLATLTGVPRVRESLVEQTNGRPGALGELTFWSELVESGQWQNLLTTAQAQLPFPNVPGCPEGITLASYRWFSVAQMAWHLPGHPKVRSFESGAKYYYYDRDKALRTPGCPVLAIGEQAHVDESAISAKMDIFAEGELMDRKYEDRPLVWKVGYLK